MLTFRFKTSLIYLLLWCFVASPAVYYAYRQAKENTILQAYLDQLNLDMTAPAWDNAKRISTQLRNDFIIDETQFKRLDMADRPFLRESSDYLLEIKEGLCGEGTRVLVNLLLLAGYDATRVSLFDRYLVSSHTLVSLQVDGEEYYIDSINTPEDVNDYINSHQINADSFNIVKYSSDVTARMDDLQDAKARFRQFSSESSDDESVAVEHHFYDRFLFYSYQALPVTKLASVFNMDVRVFSFDRPGVLVSSLAEKPYQIMSVFWLLLATGMTIFVAIVNAVIKLTRKRASS